MILKEIFNDFMENYEKVRKHLDENSKHDPVTEPYASKYAAKNILLKMKNSLQPLLAKGDTLHSDKLHAMMGAVLLNIGVIDMDTEELTSSEQSLVEAETLLKEQSCKAEIVITLIEVYNNLGILWSLREETEKVKHYFCSAKNLYEKFKSSLEKPITVECLFSELEDPHETGNLALEKAHTLTLYYLAQMYGSMKEDVKSAIYYHLTLRRQLAYREYDHIDWALNSATLSQFFAVENGFHQSRHHLAAASIILQEYEQKLLSVEIHDETYEANLENFKHRSADVARCWAKYCMILLSNSKSRLMSDDDKSYTTDLSNLSIEDAADACITDLKSLVFPNIDVSDYENKVTDKFLLTYDDARKVFLYCQYWLNKAKEYYTSDCHASDYIVIVQDSSEAYRYLSFFEENDERRAKMHKRRITLLEDLLKEINPKYYLQYCRQLWYELGEIYADILDIKLDKLNNSSDNPSPQSLQKINNMCDKSIENYEKFLNSFSDSTGIKSDLENDQIKSIVTANAVLGRIYMKKISPDKKITLINFHKSKEAYNKVISILKNNEKAAAVMKEEYSLCQEMATMLEIEINKLEQNQLNNIQ